MRLDDGGGKPDFRAVGDEVWNANPEGNGTFDFPGPTEGSSVSLPSVFPGRC